MRKVFVVGNPTAGAGKFSKYLGLLCHKLEDKNISFQVFPTKSTSNAQQIVETHFDSSFSDIIAIGGDGTLHEVVNAISPHIPLGIIAAGTGNDYVKCLDLGKTLDQKIETAIDGQIHLADVGVCNNRKFINGVGIGFDGQIVADLIQKKTWLKGVAKYYYHVLKILGSYEPRHFDITRDEKPTSAKLILACVAKGTTFGGGFTLTPHGSLTDGKLALCTIGEVSPLKRFLNIHRMQKGNHHLLNEISLSKVNTLSVGPNPSLEAHIDGEYFGQPPFHFSILKKHLLLRANKLL